MILSENKIIGQIILNLEQKFKKIKEIILNQPQHKQMYNEFYNDYRELIGKKMWLDHSDFRMERELVDEFMDLESDVNNLLEILEDK